MTARKHKPTSCQCCGERIATAGLIGGRADLRICPRCAVEYLPKLFAAAVTTPEGGKRALDRAAKSFEDQFWRWAYRRRRIDKYLLNRMGIKLDAPPGAPVRLQARSPAVLSFPDMDTTTREAVVSYLSAETAAVVIKLAAEFDDRRRRRTRSKGWKAEIDAQKAASAELARRRAERMKHYAKQV